MGSGLLTKNRVSYQQAESIFVSSALIESIEKYFDNTISLRYLNFHGKGYIQNLGVGPYRKS